jgi:hypothetical protein
MWIGISGKMGSGKDYFAENFLIPFLENKLKEKCLIISFADMIKINLMTHNNYTYDMVYIDKTNEVRNKLREEGQGKKQIYGNNIWIDYVKNWGILHMSRGVKHIIITDVRFKNEYDFINSMDGVIIRINAPNRNETRLRRESNNDDEYNLLKNHISEIELDDIDFKYNINNDSDMVNICNIHNMFHNIFIKP